MLFYFLKVLQLFCQTYNNRHILPVYFVVLGRGTCSCGRAAVGGAMARLVRQDSLLKDNKHLRGRDKMRRLGNLRPEDVAPAVRAKILDVVREPTT